GGAAALKRVRLEDARFEKEFEVVSSDQVEARYLLTPALMERLMEAQSVLGPRTRLRAAFHDRHMLLTLDTRKNRSWLARQRGKMNEMHHFEVQDISKPVEQTNLSEQFGEEIEICRKLVGALQLNMKTRI
ncbi:MAG: DUF3137 domain-containing protein, partial [Acidobacteriota bacterium]